MQPCSWGSDYYDGEAIRYDDSRGGVARARAAASGIARLVGDRGLLLDVAGGTGIVTAEFAELGFDPVVVDVSAGMAALAVGRLPGRVLLGSADRLPVKNGSVDVVTFVWLLHLLPVSTVDRAVAEAARVLRPGGRLVTTVDKPQAHGHPAAEADARDRVVRVAARAGLVWESETTFTGASQWGSATAADPVFSLVALRRTTA